MAVPFYDHRKLYTRRKTEIDQAIFRVIESGCLDWGDEVPAFEAEFANWVGAAHAVTTNSGTAALQIALLALGIGRGDEVITVTNTDIGTISAIHCTGAESVFVDVDPATLCMDVAAVRAAIGPRTRAILPVDMFGQPAALLELGDLARSKGLVMVEDACLALGAEIGGRRIGTFSDITCFSFAPTKHLGSYGSGGACVTADAALAERMRKITAYGQDRARHRQIGRSPPPLHHETEGLNARLDEIQAAILRVKLPDVEESLAVRHHQAARYAAALADLVEVPSEVPGTRHAWRNYVVHLEERDRVREGLTARGIGSALSYAPPQHLQPVYAHKGFSRGAFPVSERSGDRLLGLPIGPHHDDAAINEVADGLCAAIRTLA
ncbi:MAG: DegT/DnrJ/EryC1/StrS family aminotransferase [Methylobacterium sp.]|nr:DegT/DnrJ/EryC1/StrS family aminotransferase [Methylobacterium sp.]MCA3602378.1 DegT/DnrJ/EryC1/StrS family aminotransferase [Methylobacterium sp.]MCA3613904.1 DegT/DnrJ/EryC1/StrS family aminotransferase [Methylobacterium sp.]MCA3622578.1 DegT/DnrJ/EryC1/StrS family aminotransferase [Methylobacterium sp.]